MDCVKGPAEGRVRGPRCTPGHEDVTLSFPSARRSGAGRHVLHDNMEKKGREKISVPLPSVH